MRRVREIETFDDCTLDLGGVAIAIAIDDSVGPDIRRSLRRHFRPAPLADVAPTATIEVSRGPLPGPIPAPTLSSALGQELRSDGRLTEVRSATTVARWSCDDASVSVAPDGDPDEVGYVVGMVATELCSRAGIDAVHAALIVGPRRSALVLGASGQGKSTTAGSALLAGLQVASDDAVLVRRSDCGVEGWGLPRTLAVPREVGAGRGPVDHRDRVSIHDHDPTGRWHPIDEVLVVGHGTAAATSLAALSHTELLREVLAANLGSLRAGGERERSLALFAALGERPRRRLALGADPDQRSATTGAILRDLLGGHDAGG